MAIHRIEVGNTVFYTGDAGVEQFDNALRELLQEEIERLKEHERRKRIIRKD